MQSKNKLVRAISAEELQGFLDELSRTAGVDGPMIQELAESRFGVEMGHNSAAHFKKEVYTKYLEQVGKSKALAQMITANRDPDNGMTLAEASSEFLQQRVFEFMIENQTGLDLSTSEGMKRAKGLADIIKSARSEDRKKIDALNKLVDDTKDDLTNRELSEAQREARIRERFGV
jgi:hypothetical protein